MCRVGVCLSCKFVFTTQRLQVYSVLQEIELWQDLLPEIKILTIIQFEI